jgi:hypothetical protein
MAKPNKKPDLNRQRADETFLQWQARLARQRDLEASKKQPLVTPEAARNGAYEDGFTEVDGMRASVKINRGGSTIQRWLNEPQDRDHPTAFDDGERAAIRYCQKLWAWLDYHGRGIVFVDNGLDGMAEHEALAELATLKRKLPSRYWAMFENVCRFELAASRRDTKTVVAFVAGLIAMWRGL